MDNKAAKLQKQAIRDQLRRIKPGECQKYVRLILDSSLIEPDCVGRELLVELTNLQLKFEVRNLPLERSVYWERQATQRELTQTIDSNAALSPSWTKESQLLHFMTTSALQQAAKQGKLSTIAGSMKSPFPEMQSTLVLLHKGEKSQTLTNALVELQLFHQMRIQQSPPTANEVAALLRHFTKAIAEAPYKQQKAEVIGTFKKFLANDKKQCVRVDGTTGFGRLWQQHLNRLPMVTLEVAESIIGQYSCPRKLVKALEVDEEAMEKLADVRINRAGPQPLQTDRRIGQVLSGKLQLLYTSRDPNALI